MAILKDMTFVSGVGLNQEFIEKNGSSYLLDQVIRHQISVNNLEYDILLYKKHLIVTIRMCISVGDTEDKTCTITMCIIFKA